MTSSGYPTPQPDATVARLSAQIEALRGEVVPRLERIERQVDRTNGRVTALELHDAHEAGVHQAEGVAEGNRRRGDDRSWALRMLALTVVGSVVSGLTVALVLIALTN